MACEGEARADSTLLERPRVWRIDTCRMHDASMIRIVLTCLFFVWPGAAGGTGMGETGWTSGERALPAQGASGVAWPRGTGSLSRCFSTVAVLAALPDPSERSPPLRESSTRVAKNKKNVPDVLGSGVLVLEYPGGAGRPARCAACPSRRSGPPDLITRRPNREVWVVTPVAAGRTRRPRRATPRPAVTPRHAPPLSAAAATLESADRGPEGPEGGGRACFGCTRRRWQLAAGAAAAAAAAAGCRRRLQRAAARRGLELRGGLRVCFACSRARRAQRNQPDPRTPIPSALRPAACTGAARPRLRQQRCSSDRTT